MINVPQEIKDLFHLDSCPKNIRIHFPNGERTDICNDKIVKDTVSFKESLCSQNELKFGLCESPVFECETVGVGNVTGATIEVFCEVYCGASVEGAVFQPDLQHYVYQVPYGVFVIQEATRQADMAHRKIVAYGGTTSAYTKLKPFEQNKIHFWPARFSSVVYNPNSFLLAMANIGARNYSLNVFNETEITLNQYPTPANLRYTWTDQEDVYSLVIDVGVLYVRNLGGYQNSLFHINGIIKQDVVKEAVSKIIEVGRSYGMPQLEDKYWKELLLQRMYDYVQDEQQGYARTLRDYDFQLPFLFYPYLGANVRVDTLRFYYRVEKIYVEKNSQTVEEIVLNKEFITTDKCVKLDVKDSYLNNFTISFSFEPEEVGSNWYDFVPPEDYSNLDILQGIIEIIGKIGYYTRDSKLDLVDIKRQFILTPNGSLYPNSNVYPEGVTGGKLLPEDYQSCWYDDNYQVPVQAIQCQYKNTNNEDATYTHYMTGYSAISESLKIYDLSNNMIIAGDIWTEAQIQAICQKIATNFEGVSYMPVDFVGRGLPYVEAGDTFEILTKSHDSITTIVLDRTITGEMTLTDSYKSV